MFNSSLFFDNKHHYNEIISLFVSYKKTKLWPTMDMLALREWYFDRNILNWSRYNAPIQLKADQVLHFTQKHRDLLKSLSESIPFKFCDFFPTHNNSEISFLYRFFSHLWSDFVLLPRPAHSTGNISDKLPKGHHTVDFSLESLLYTSCHLTLPGYS